MRLTALTLTRYGPFRANRIVFDPAPGRLNLLIAPNGAGKSVLRTAFGDLLFGIHPQSDMGFRFGYHDMRLMAEAVAPDGALFAFGRRKGMGNTLIGADGAPLDPALLAHVLGRTDKALLERLFALDTERLREGGNALLASSGDVANALLSAAGGLRQARQMRAALEEQRDALAPAERRVASRPFYQALDAVLDARKRLDAAVLKPDVRARQETELAHLRATLHEQEKRAKAASACIARLERVRRVAGPLRQHDDAASWLAANPGAPVLPAEIGARLAAAAGALRQAELLVAREQQALAEAVQRAEALACDEPLLEAGAAIDDLVKRSGVATQAARDIPRRDAELAQAEQRISELLRQLGSALPPARAAEAIPQAAVVVEARRLFPDHEKLRADLDRLPGERDEAVRQISVIEEELGRLPPPVDTAALVRAAKEIRRAGDPAQRAEEASRAVAEAMATLAAVRAEIPFWGERVAALPVQPPSAYERLDAARSEAATALKTTEAALAKLRQQNAEQQARRADLDVSGPLPDAAVVGAARAKRDRGWHLIYRRAFTPEPPHADEEAAWAGDMALPLAYERAVAEADALADQCTRESDRVATGAAIDRSLAALRTEIAVAESLRATQEAAQGATLGAWREALAPLNLPPETTLSDLRIVLAARDKAIEAELGVARARAAQDALAARQVAEAARLATALGIASAPSDPTALPSLLSQAEQRIDDAQQADRERSRLRDRLDARRQEKQKIVAALVRAEARMETLLQAWGKLRIALGRPADEAPATTHALLDHFASLDAETQKAATAEQRLREMRDDIAALQVDAAALAARVAPDLGQAEVGAIIETLRRRLAEQRGHAKQREELLAQQARAHKSLEAERKKHGQCEIALRAVLDTVGTATVEAAEPLIELASTRMTMAETLRRTAEELAAAGDGHSLEALRAEIATVEPDTILSEKEAAEVEHDQAWDEVKTLSARVATEEKTMTAQAAEIAAVQAEADRQAAVATLGRVLDDGLERHLAALILGEALRQVDAAGTSTLLTRIGGLFRTLTGGAYERLIADDQGDGSARLLAVELAFPDEAKPVAALSDGTRDQLFLALRLAAIEDHVATAPPLPFIGDDILQTFDNERSLAAMRALLDASAHVQVILLSHHPHVRDLASMLGKNEIHICEIEPAAG